MKLTLEGLVGWVKRVYWDRAEVAGWVERHFVRKRDIRAGLQDYYDTLYVALTGAQTVAGAKTFSSLLASLVGIKAAAASPYVLLENSTAGNGYFRLIQSGNIHYFQSGLAATAGSAADIYFTDMFNSNTWMAIKADGKVGVGTVLPAAKVEVKQPSTTAAIPVLILEQADLSEELIRFNGTVGAGNPIDTAVTGASYGKIRVSVNGVYKYIPLYDS